jgi:hypothetical protein
MSFSCAVGYSKNIFKIPDLSLPPCSCIVHISLLNLSILYFASDLALDLYIYLDPHLLSFRGKKGFKIKDNFSNFMNVSFLSMESES